MIGHYTIRACILVSEGPYFSTPMARAADHDHTHHLECEMKVKERGTSLTHERHLNSSIQGPLSFRD